MNLFPITRAGYAMRLEASTLAARRFAYPELGDVAPSAQGAGERQSTTRACPRALCKIASTVASAEGGAILHNVSRYLKFSAFN